MISLADLAREADRERSRTHKEIAEAEVGDTQAAIRKPPEGVARRMNP